MFNDNEDNNDNDNNRLMQSRLFLTLSKIVTVYGKKKAMGLCLSNPLTISV